MAPWVCKGAHETHYARSEWGQRRLKTEGGRNFSSDKMTTTKQRKIRVLLDELIHNLDSEFYWANEYDLNKPCDDKDNLDALYVLQRYVENIERIIDSVRCLII